MNLEERQEEDGFHIGHHSLRFFASFVAEGLDDPLSNLHTIGRPTNGFLNENRCFFIRMGLN
jgi:hypothetical protein